MAAVNKLPGIRRADVALGGAAGAAAVLWLAVSIGGAAAGQWTITPRVGVGQAITDNARSTSADTDTDLISTATAGLGVIGTGARAQVSFDYDLAYDKYWENDDLDGLRHDLLGDGTAELYREHLFFDARGAVSQQAIRRDGVQTATGRTAADNQTVVINYALGPVLRNRFGDWAESELRYRFGQVLFADPDVGGGADTPDDATTHRASASLTSGRRFTRYRWSLVGDALRTEQDNNDTFESTGVDLIGEYDVNRFATLLGRVGYEEIDDDAGEDFSEVTWRAGARFTAGPRTQFRLEYGRRFDSSVWSGELVYRISARTELSAAYDETLETNQQALGANLAGFARDAETGELIDPTTGGVADPNDSAFDLGRPVVQAAPADRRAGRASRPQPIPPVELLHDAGFDFQRGRRDHLRRRRALRPAADAQARRRHRRQLLGPNQRRQRRRSDLSRGAIRRLRLQQNPNRCRPLRLLSQPTRRGGRSDGKRAVGQFAQRFLKVARCIPISIS